MNKIKDILKESLVYAFDANVPYRRLLLHYHNLHELFLCSSGSGDQFTDNGKEKMQAGDLFFFPAGLGHRASGSLKENAVGWVVNFGDEIFSRDNPADEEALTCINVLTKWSKSYRCKLSINSIIMPELIKNIKEMTNETRNESAGANMLLKSYVMKLLLIILRNSSLNANFRDKLNQDNLEIKVERICEYLKHNYTRPVKVEEIADYFKISRSYFHAVFLKYTGLTMTQYINRMRCSSAIKLLQTTDYPLEKVSELSGFGSVCSLYQRMKLDTGHPVSFYRNKIHKPVFSK